MAPTEPDASLGARVAALQEEIRALKADLKAAGHPSDAVNRNCDVLAKVQALKQLKSALDADDPARDEAIAARLQAERDEERRREQALAQAQREELRAAEGRAPRPLVQRKIYHLFRHAGNGPTFHYEPPARLNSAQCGFGSGQDPHPAVYVTEKWDGTTMQATSSHIFKRLDLWGGKRRAAEPTDRYDLRLVAWRGEDTGGKWRGLDFVEADARVAEAVGPHLEKLEALDEGLCVYFEVVHTAINATFRHLPGLADLRVFDFSRGPSAAQAGSSDGGGEFLPFEETIALAARFGLPLVGWERLPRLDADDMWARLVAAVGRPYATAAAPLEGYVVREAGTGGRIAKARVEHLHVASNAGGSSGGAAAAAPAPPAARRAAADAGRAQPPPSAREVQAPRQAAAAEQADELGAALAAYQAAGGDP